MSLRFDATLKDLGQASPRGVLAAFDAPTTLPTVSLNLWSGGLGAGRYSAQRGTARALHRDDG